MRINGAAVREIRQRSGVSVTALAERAGIKQSHLSNIEAGRRQASPEVIEAIKQALKVSDITAIISDPPAAVAS